MDKKKLIIAAAAALLAVVLLYMYIETMKSEIIKVNRQKSRYIVVLFAKRDISAGAILDDTLVEEREIPELYLPENKKILLASKNEVIRKEALIPIYKGEIITSNKFRSASAGGDRLAQLVDPDKRAVTIPVDALSNFNGMLCPGDKIDIIVTSGRGGGVKTFIFLQNIEVIATGQYLKTEQEKVGKGIGQYATVTFCLNVEDAQKLIFLENAGVDLRFVMRSKFDEKQVPSKVINQVGKM